MYFLSVAAKVGWKPPQNMLVQEVYYVACHVLLSSTKKEKNTVFLGIMMLYQFLLLVDRGYSRPYEKNVIYKFMEPSWKISRKEKAHVEVCKDRANPPT
jgi:hypothetical protein